MATQHAPLASLRRRALAYVVDAAVVGALAGTLTGRSDEAAGRSRLRTAALAALLGAVYHVVLEGLLGKTVGKHLLGISIVREDGRPLTVRDAGTRTAWRAVDWLPVNYAVGVLAIVTSDRNQRLGDRRAGTVVVRAPAEAEVDPEVVAAAERPRPREVA